MEKKKMKWGEEIERETDAREERKEREILSILSVIR